METISLKQHFRDTFKLALPVAIGQLGQVAFGVTDSIMIGHVGSAHLAASSLVNGIYFLVLILGIGLSSAITPLVAIAKGAKNDEECGIILRQSLLVNLLVALIIFAVLFVLAYFIVDMNQPPEVVELSKSYLIILSFAVFPFIIFATYKQFLEGISITRPAMYIILVANIFNFFGNYVLIYGKFGFPRLELDGAGYATLTTRTFLAVVLFLYVIYNSSLKKYDPSLKFRNINFIVIKKYLNLGIPSGLQYFFEVSSFAFGAIMIGWLGKNELAAHQISLNLASITYMTILGISIAASIRVGSYYGAGNYREAERAGYSAFQLTSMLMIVFGALFIIFRNYLPYIYNSEPDVVKIASVLIVVAAFFQLSDGNQAIGMGSLRGITDVKIPMYFSLFSYWVVGIGVGYILGFIFNFGVVGVWIGFLSGLTITAIFFVFRFRLKVKQLYS